MMENHPQSLFPIQKSVKKQVFPPVPTFKSDVAVNCTFKAITMFPVTLGRYDGGKPRLLVEVNRTIFISNHFSLQSSLFIVKSPNPLSQEKRVLMLDANDAKTIFINRPGELIPFK